MITIKDVAKVAGVSVATVSIVLNKKRPVRRDTAERVLDAARKLNYKPNLAAMSLITKKTKILGVLIPNILNPFFAPMIKGIEERANKEGYVVMMADSDEDPNKAKIQLDVLAQHSVDGIIISVADEFERYIGFVQNLGIPTVLVDRELPGLDIDLVQTDNELGAYLATRHLCSIGRTRIGVIIGHHTISTHGDRLRGYRKALDENGITYDESLLRICQSNKEDGYDQTLDLLASKPVPDALLVGSGRLGAGCYQAIMDSNLSVPKELSWICYDETEWTRLVRPTVTTVKQNTYQMGISAVELVFQRLASVSRGNTWPEEEKEAALLPPQKIRLEPELVVRESTSAGDRSRKKPVDSSNKSNV